MWLILCFLLCLLFDWFGMESMTRPIFVVLARNIRLKNDVHVEFTILLLVWSWFLFCHYKIVGSALSAQNSLLHLFVLEFITTDHCVSTNHKLLAAVYVSGNVLLYAFSICLLPPELQIRFFLSLENWKCKHEFTDNVLRRSYFSVGLSWEISLKNLR